MTGVVYDKAALLKAADKEIRIVLRGALNAVKEETRALELDLEEVTRAAVPGSLYRGWQSKTVKKIAREPAGWVYFAHGPRSQGALSYWTQPGRVSRGGGQYLAVATKAAGGRVFGRGRGAVSNSPEMWKKQHPGQKLSFRPGVNGKNPVLVLERARLSKKTGRAHPASKRAIRKGEDVSIVMFVLIPYFDQANMVAIEPVIERHRGLFPGTLEHNMKAVFGQN
jgi:hypothetical protein